MKAVVTPAVSAIPTKLLQVGLEVFPVYGDEVLGFSMESEDLNPDVPRFLRYNTLEELFFALINFNLSPEGEA